jgi:serine/threonine protein kinase
MIRIKLSAGSKYSSTQEAHAIEQLQRILSTEDGYLIPIVYVGKQISNFEIDAVLILPDAIFFLDFKQWYGQRIEVEGLNGKVRRFIHGAWETGKNTLPNYEKAARIMADKLKQQAHQWLPTPPHIYSALVFTHPPKHLPPRVSFAGGNPNKPVPQAGVGACNIEQVPLLISSFRAASNTPQVSLTKVQQAALADFFLQEATSRPDLAQRRIEGYRIIAEHHTDTFLNCKVYTGQGDLLDEQVWIKEYERVFTSPEERTKRDRLILRHADVLNRFPQYPHIVNYCAHKSTDSHLYVILSRQPGVFLSELLIGQPLGDTTSEDLKRVPFNLSARLHILADLLDALYYLTQQQGFEQSAYRDLRPDSIFIRYTGISPVAQLFNFDCTRLPSTSTKRSNMRSGQTRVPQWNDYASPELLQYIDSTNSDSDTSFTGDISSDLFSWAIIAWELLTGDLPFLDTEAKLKGERRPWPTKLTTQLQEDANNLSLTIVHLIKACLELSPTRRPTITLVRNQFL